MKTQFFKSLSFGLLLSVALLSTSCKENEILNEVTPTEADKSDKLGIPTKFDEIGFALLLEEYMEPKVAGFGYAIYNDGKEYYRTNGGDGWARKKIETPFQLHGAIVKQEIVTSTQFVTAVAVMRALEIYNLSLSSKVWPFLPKFWVPSDEFKSLTFERLLAHKTGLINYNDLTKLRQTVEGPVNNALFSTESYQNNDVNYLLLGIILPYIQAKKLADIGSSSMLNTLNKFDENFVDYGSYFRSFVRTNVFTPAGLNTPTLVDWQPWDHNGTYSPSLATKGYPSKNGEEPGIVKGINRFNCGVTGLYISASEFGKIQSAVAKNKVISATSLTNMKTKMLGFDNKLVGTKGAYYWKRGVGDNCETMIFDFGKVQVAVFANSLQSDISSPTVLAQMFENSFIPL
ncbi:serine hydrolase domain-containing protein [Dyadobacter diqingensis]|uniref:serine hydrolase domain-containing protein n=1 Tax=Dyadobacter diqingensis TaxID=2938121 RepID=UPI0020C1A2B8|nr:serine hydrolase domain-containing protein [Dyadobacter diqingensis]